MFVIRSFAMDPNRLSDTSFRNVLNMLFSKIQGLDERIKNCEGNKLIIYLTQPT